jgi:hypothetical protein
MKRARKLEREAAIIAKKTKKTKNKERQEQGKCKADSKVAKVKIR